MGLGFLKHIEYLATSDSSLHGASLTRCGSKFELINIAHPSSVQHLILPHYC